MSAEIFVLNFRECTIQRIDETLFREVDPEPSQPPGTGLGPLSG